MDGSNSIADDLLRSGFERWQRLEGEKQAISEDLKELFAELKGQGLDSKALRAAFRTVAKAGDVAVEEHNAMVDLYVGSLTAPRISDIGTKIALTQARDAGGADKQKPDPIAALRADPAMAIVEPANLKKNTETQPAPQAGSDLTETSQATGQVAPHPVANVEEEANGRAVTSDDAASREVDDADRQQVVASGFSGDGEDGTSALSTLSETDKSAQASASAAPVSKYAAPGEITWETHPPEGVERGAISMAFGTMGQDTEVIADELERGAAQPIVKRGNVILDGWARFMAARNMRELDGSPLAYPVVQYDGTDILVDIIKLNVEGRILTEQQKRMIAANLSRQEPSRKADIHAAFELWMEPV